MVTTVKERLDYSMSALIKSIDMLVAKETTNTIAKADITVKDNKGTVIVTLAKDVPVSCLLQLEKRFVDLRRMYDKLPTFNTEINWVKGINIEDVLAIDLSRNK